MTEHDENPQNGGESRLTARQLRFLPLLLANPTYTAACEAGRVSRNALYEWLRQPAFKAELDRRRDELAEQGFTLLAQNISKAVEVLVKLLDSGDPNVRRLAAVNILSQHTKLKELGDIVSRIEAIEERLRLRA